MNYLFPPQQFKINAKQCFVIMPFNPVLKNVYDMVESIVEDYCGLTCVRADKISRSERITNDIWTNINEARFLIADLTGRNANVFYELGLAHARSKPVILLTQNHDDVPFDLKDIRHIIYEPDDLAGLKSNLRKYIRDRISTIPRDWNSYYCPSNWDSPYIKIVSLDAPESVRLGEIFSITLSARNNGKPATEGYFSVSFPHGVDKLSIIDSNARTKIGVKGDLWANGREILSYPIAEGFKWGDKPSWFNSKTYYIKAQAQANRRGYLWFYVSASGRNLESSDNWTLEPEQPLLDIDQRGENVYCGVIEVI